MIVTTLTNPARTLGTGGESIRWRCLARRGMVHSECESFDHLHLAPGTEFALHGRAGTEQVWFTLRGTGQLSNGPGDTISHPVRAGDLVLTGHDGGEQAVLRAGATGLDVLWLSVWPAAVTRALPARKPVMS